MRPAWLGLALALAACGDPGVVVEPIVDYPAAGSDGAPWDGLTDLELAITDGDGVDLQVASGPIGEALGLGGVEFGDDRVLHLSGRAGEVETAYGRSCGFAVGPGDGPITPHLYFARIVRWAAGPAPAVAERLGGHAYATADGRGVFVGGGPGAGVERFDPQDGGFHAIALEPALSERSGAVLVAQPDGRAWLVGGQDAAGDGVPLIEVIDPRPEGEVGVPLESQDGPRVIEPAAAVLVDGTVLVVGGRTQPAAGGSFTTAATAYLLGFGGAVLEPPRLIGSQMTFARAGHSATRLGDEVGADVLLIGGRGDDGLPIAQAELYRPLRGAFEVIATAQLVTPRWGHVAIRLPGGFVLIVGGYTDDPVGDAPLPVDTVELYDPIQGRFSAAGTLPARAGISQMTVTPLPDGRVLLAGGLAADGLPVDTALIARFDPLNGTVDFSATDRMDAPRAGHAATRLCDGTILVVGGALEPGAPPSERYDPISFGRR